MMSGAATETDAEFEAKRDKAYAEVQVTLGGKYTLEVVASVCCTVLCQTVALAGESIETTEDIIEEFMSIAREEMRSNWDLLQQTNSLLRGAPQGRA